MGQNAYWGLSRKHAEYIDAWQQPCSTNVSVSSTANPCSRPSAGSLPGRACRKPDRDPAQAWSTQGQQHSVLFERHPANGQLLECHIHQRHHPCWRQYLGPLAVIVAPSMNSSNPSLPCWHSARCHHGWTWMTDHWACRKRELRKRRIHGERIGSRRNRYSGCNERLAPTAVGRRNDCCSVTKC